MARIMVEDDSTSIRFLMREILVRLGHVVVGEAENGVIAVDKYRLLRPELVTMDVNMPEKDGIQALREIKEFHNKAKVIMISVINRFSLIHEVMEAGA